MAVIKIEAKKDTRCTQTVCLIQGDRRTQILRFSVNRYDGGVDLADLVWVIKTVNAKGVDDVFEPAAVEISESRITIDWLVDGTVTDASGMAKYELNGLDATVEGKAVIWKGGTGTMSLRANIGENFGNIDMTNIDRLVLYVEGRLQDIIDLTGELQGAGDAANAAAIAANAGAQRAEAEATAANAGATAATEAASNANAAADAANTAALPHAQLYGMRVRGETAKATDNPVTFLPDAGSLLNPVTVLEPQQQGSGDPYPAGGGKNLFDANAVLKDSSNWAYADVQLEPNTTYTMSTSLPEAVANGGIGIFVFKTGDDASGAVNKVYDTRPVTFTTAADGIAKLQWIVEDTQYKILAYNYQIEEGSTATEYAPPENIRPFIGYDKLGLNAAGKNLVPNFVNYTLNGITMTASADGTITLNGTSTGGGFTYLIREFNLPAGSYALSLNNETAVGSGGADTVYCVARDAANDWTVQAYCIQSNTIGVGTTGVGIVDFMLVVPAGVTLDNYKMAIQLEVGSAVTEWKPYQGKLHTVQIGQTVYGFRYEWLTGKGVIEWVKYELDGTERFEDFGDRMYLWVDYSIPFALSREPESGLCSHGLYAYDLHNTIPFNAFVGTDDSTGNYIGLRGSHSAFDSLDTLNAFIAAEKAAGTPVQIAYKLATPVEIQLTPHVISAVEPEQTNTLYGDGNIDVEYVKPLHVSIEERVAAALAAAMNTEGE